MQSVLFIEAQMKQYRAPFYEQLHRLLRRDGISLKVAYSAPPESESRKQDTCDLPKEYGCRVPAWWLWPNKLLLQPVLGKALASDLVIVDQGNTFLLNHLLLPLARTRLHRVALWGHAQNRQPRQIAFSEWYRRKAVRWPSWWFAYTKNEASYLTSRGMSPARITVIQNSLDTRRIRDEVQKITPDRIADLRTQLGIVPPCKVGIFCGMLDQSKGIQFLVDASHRVKEAVPGFHLIIVGGGPEEPGLKTMVHSCPWIHVLGPKFGAEKAQLLAASDVFLLPGAVGLAILDAFAASLPLVTTKMAAHGPEVEYLEHGVNGVTTEGTTGSYADAVVSLLSSPEALRRYRAAASQSSEQYSMESMVMNFHQGILSCFGMVAGAERKFSTDFDSI